MRRKMNVAMETKEAAQILKGHAEHQTWSQSKWKERQVGQLEEDDADEYVPSETLKPRMH